MHQYQVKVVNLLINKDFELSLNNLKIKIIPDRNFNIESIIKEDDDSSILIPIVGAELCVESIDAADTQLNISDVKNTLKYICELLSFISSSSVAEHAFWINEKPPILLSQSLSPARLVRRHRCPIFSYDETDKIKDFLEQTYCKYVELRDCRELNVAIDYYVLSDKPGTPLEVKLIILCILLENLKYTFAMEQKFPFKGGKFKYCKKDLSFKDLLEMMLTQVGMTLLDMQRIIDLRNDLLHSGLTLRSSTDAKMKQTNEMQKQYEEIKSIIQEYILRLLGYKGKYRSYQNLCEEVEIQ